MKRTLSRLLLASLLLISLFFFCSCGEEASAHMGFQIISSDVNDFHLEVPATWTVTSQNGIASALSDGAVEDQSNISVMSVTAQSEDGVDGYFAKLEESYAALYSDIVYEEKGVESTLGEAKAKKYVFTASVMGEEFKFMQILCLHEGRIYTFTYTSTPKFYSVHEAEVGFILSYFAYKN